MRKQGADAAMGHEKKHSHTGRCGSQGGRHFGKWSAPGLDRQTELAGRVQPHV
jgi:hypothetical protein